jgi:hypothetical protein
MACENCRPAAARRLMRLLCCMEEVCCCYLVARAERSPPKLSSESYDGNL